MEENYLQSARKQFEYYKSLGDKTFARLTEAELLWQPNAASNSIAVMVNHLSGNMLSRWTDFLAADGEKEWRNRDQEFEDLIRTQSDLLEKWKAGWKCLFTALDAINDSTFHNKILIRNQQHSIVEAVNRQLCHYAYHVGQIVYVGRMIQNSDWKSLSIPKGGSKQFNAEKFAKGQHDGHFSDDIK